jgi:sortase A
MTDTESDTSEPGASEPGTSEAVADPAPSLGAGRRVVRGIGEVCLTLGALLLLLCVYQLFWTNVTSAAAISASRDELAQQWRDAPHAQASAVPPLVAPSYGKTFALLYIPRLKARVWGLPLAEGTGKDVLARGAGHYVASAMPGEVGNFALAAHRSTHDEPFADFPDLRAGDKVYVQTQYTWYVYTLTQDDSTLAPSDVWVVDPVPGRPGAAPTEKLLTMTTCTPRYGSTGRWAWWGRLTAQSSTSAPAPDGITPVS